MKNNGHPKKYSQTNGLKHVVWLFFAFEDKRKDCGICDV